MFWVAPDVKEGFFFLITQALTETLYTDDIHSSCSLTDEIETWEMEERLYGLHRNSVKGECMKGSQCTSLVRIIISHRLSELDGLSGWGLILQGACSNKVKAKERTWSLNHARCLPNLEMPVPKVPVSYMGSGRQN